MCDEVGQQDVESLRLPKNWQSSVRNAVLNVIGIVRIATLAGREALITNGDVKDARIHQLESEVAMLREELRIKDARMQRVGPHRRPQYTSIERMAILELRAMRGWNKTETARRSRRSMGFAVFKYRPTSGEVTAALDRIIAAEQVCPKHLIVDQGPEFDCQHFKDVWCKARSILYRFGAINKHGSLAVVERFHRTMKELLRLIVIPEDQSRFEHEVACILDWYNEARPRMTLNGKTPNEVYFSRTPANEQSRIEPRPRWPRDSACAKPQVDIDGAAGDPVSFEIGCLECRRYLPVIRARCAA